MKIQGNISLDIRDISLTYDYGRVILNAGNKQVSISLTKEAAEQLQHELYNTLPTTPHSTAYRNYLNLKVMDGDPETVAMALKDLQKEGKIDKSTKLSSLTVDERDMINEWRMNYYSKMYEKKEK